MVMIYRINGTPIITQAGFFAVMDKLIQKINIEGQRP